jgi:protocatechuate 3,4-dioxygenase beta subunit
MKTRDIHALEARWPHGGEAPPAGPVAAALTRRRFVETAIGALGGMVLLEACGTSGAVADAAALGDAASGSGGEGGSAGAGGLSGGAGASGTGGSGVAACTLTPEQEEGPFYVDEGLLRPDVTDGQTGIAMKLVITVVGEGTCTPVVDAAIDIWSANHLGAYSDEAQQGTVGQKYLRGIQLTDAAGQVRFTTLYPGWYAGRTCHVHIKVRLGGTAATATSYDSTGSTVAHGGQLFFPSDQNAALRALYPDDTNDFINNDADRVYTGQGGATALVTLTGTATDGFTASVTVAVAM